MTAYTIPTEELLYDRAYRVPDPGPSGYTYGNGVYSPTRQNYHNLRGTTHPTKRGVEFSVFNTEGLEPPYRHRWTP